MSKKPQPVVTHPNIPLVLYRGEKPLDEKTVAFRVEPKLTKPEIRQYLEKGIYSAFCCAIIHLSDNFLWG